MLLDRIRDDLKNAMKTEVRLRKSNEYSKKLYEIVVAQKTVSRAIISMFPEIGKKPEDGTDDDVIKLVKKYINQQKERQLYIDKHIIPADVDGIKSSELKRLINKKYQELGSKLSSPEIIIAQKYLPVGPTEEEISKYIREHVDLSQFKNKMQAMGQIMKAFPGCDGNFVKNILLKI